MAYVVIRCSCKFNPYPLVREPYSLAALLIEGYAQSLTHWMRYDSETALTVTTLQEATIAIWTA
jgi:hypothetical protein